MTNQTNPAASMPITMEDSKQPQQHIPSIPSIAMPFPQFELMSALLSALDAHITKQVEAKFNAMVDNRRALQLMDDALEMRITDKIIEAIAEHENTEEHFDRGAIDQMAADQARETLSEYAERQEGWVTKDRVKDIITEHVDEELDMIDWEEKVKDVLREML